MSAVSFVDQPLVVTLTNAEAGDGGEILLFAIDGQDALVLAAREFDWVPLSTVLVETSTALYERTPDESE